MGCLRKTIFRTLTIPLLVLAALFFAPTVNASCEPMPTLVWSSPFDGQTHVPLDAKLSLIGEREGREISLNGEAVSGDSSGFIHDLGGLEPDTDYEILVISREGSETIQFSTGAGDGVCGPEPQEAPFVDCSAVLSAQGCFDIDYDTAFFSPSEADEPLAWVIQTDEYNPDAVALWPSECGVPCMNATWEDPLISTELRLVELDVTGEGLVVEEGVRFAGYYGECGMLCSTGPALGRALSWPGVAFLLLGVWVLRRRRVR